MAMVMEVAARMSMMDKIIMAKDGGMTTTKGNSLPKYILFLVDFGIT